MKAAHARFAGALGVLTLSTSAAIAATQSRVSASTSLDASTPTASNETEPTRAQTEAIVIPEPASRAMPGGPPLRLVDAVRTTLEFQPLLRIGEMEVARALGSLRSAQGQFDSSLNATFGRFREETPTTTAEEMSTGLPSIVNDLSNYRLELSKQLRTGLTITPSVEMNRTSSSLATGTFNRGTLTVGITQPLLRGRGRDVVAANEIVNELGVEVTHRDFEQLRSENALVSVVAYWSYLAAQRRLEIFKASEERSRILLEQTQALIDADNRPAADIKQVQANLSDRLSLRVGAEQAFYQAQQALGLALGISNAEINLLSLPGDDFPEIEARALMLDDAPFVEQAIDRRPDLIAARERARQSSVLVTAAENGVRPQLDLSVAAGYSGIDEGVAYGHFFSPFWESVAGPSASVSLTFQFPFANNVAEGQLSQSQSTFTQANLQVYDLERNIRSNVLVARENLARSAQRVQNSRVAATLYRSAIADERTKQQLGLSTVIDLIITEDRLTASLLDEIDARLNYAAAVASLRFETGTLLRRGPVEYAVEMELLTTIPNAEEEEDGGEP